MKHCRGCEKSLPIEAFGLNGRRSRCKACRNSQSAEWRRKHPDRQRAASRRWERNNPEKVRAASALLRLKNRHRHKAQEARRYHRNSIAILSRRREARRNDPDRFRTYDVAAYRKNREAKLASARQWKWLNRYGISRQEYERMVSEQKNRCAICGEAEKVSVGGNVQRLSVDHCHATGVVRGLLCRECNAALGRMERVPSWATKALGYLEAARRRGAA